MSQIPFNIDLFRQGVPAFYNPRGPVWKYTYVKDMPNGEVMCQIERSDGTYGCDIWGPDSMKEKFTMEKPELWIAFPVSSIGGYPVFFSEEQCNKSIGGADRVALRIYETPHFDEENKIIKRK